MREIVVAWYGVVSQLYAVVALPVRGLGDGLGVPLISALLFGLLGAVAPCQLTTNAGALAFVARRAADRGAVARGALAYLLGKMVVYTVLGVAVILAGRQLAQGLIPAIGVARKVAGPLMLVLGLLLLGFVPLRFSLGRAGAAWLEARAGSGARGAFVLGSAFSLCFCPTHFLLFFGLTIPLALRSSFGAIYPAVFAIGTTLPLLGLAALLVGGVGAVGRYLAGARRLDAWLRPIAAVVLLLAGLNDTLVYWFL